MTAWPCCGTTQCDRFYDFAPIRDATVKGLNLGDASRCARLTAGALATDEDRRTADYVLLNNRERYIAEVSSVRSWRLWAYNKLPDGFGREFTTVGVGVGAVLLTDSICFIVVAPLLANVAYAKLVQARTPVGTATSPNP